VTIYADDRTRERLAQDAIDDYERESNQRAKVLLVVALAFLGSAVILAALLLTGVIK